LRPARTKSSGDSISTNGGELWHTFVIPATAETEIERTATPGQPRPKKKECSSEDWGHGSSSRVPTYQIHGTEFKPRFQGEKKRNKFHIGVSLRYIVSTYANVAINPHVQLLHASKLKKKYSGKLFIVCCCLFVNLFPPVIHNIAPSPWGSSIYLLGKDFSDQPIPICHTHK
jgi:hypothetical protein